MARSTSARVTAMPPARRGWLMAKVRAPGCHDSSASQKPIAAAVGRDAVAGLQAEARVVPAFRLDRPDLGLGGQRLGRQGAAGDQPAAAGADRQRIERQAGRLGILDQLQRHGALAGDDVRMVEGRDQRRAARLRPAARPARRGRRRAGRRDGSRRPSGGCSRP